MLNSFRRNYLPLPLVQLVRILGRTVLVGRRSSMYQICASVVLFANPGLYGSITGLGAGGGRPSSAQVGSITNCAL